MSSITEIGIHAALKGARFPIIMGAPLPLYIWVFALRLCGTGFLERFDFDVVSFIRDREHTAPLSIGWTRYLLFMFVAVIHTLCTVATVALVESRSCNEQIVVSN